MCRCSLAMVGPSSCAATRRLRPMPVSRKRPSASVVTCRGTAMVNRVRYRCSSSSAQPFLGLDGFEPGAEVFPGCRVDLHQAEGRARNRLPLEIDDLAGDRHVIVRQSNRQVVPLTVWRDLHPAGAVVWCRGRDDGVLIPEFRFRYRELEAAVRSGRRILGRGGRLVGIAPRQSSGTASHRGRAARPARAPGREKRLCRVYRADSVRAAGRRSRPFVVEQDSVWRPTSAKAPV